MIFCFLGPGTDVFSPRKYRGDHPAVHISWNDADAYCKWKEARWLIFFYDDLSCLVLSCLVLPCLVLSRLVIISSYSILLHFTLSYLLYFSYILLCTTPFSFSSLSHFISISYFLLLFFHLSVTDKQLFFIHDFFSFTYSSPLSALHDYTYNLRLPTEAEWEYAAIGPGLGMELH